MERLAGWLAAKSSRGSFFKQLLGFTFFIGIIATILTGMFSYHQSARIIRENITNENRHILQQSGADLSGLFYRLDTNTIMLSNTQAVQQAVGRALSARDFQLIAQLNRALSTAQIAIGVPQLGLVNYRHSWALNTNGFYRAPELDPVVARLGEQIQTNRNYSYLLVDREKGGKTVQGLAYVRQMPMFATDHRCVLIASISAQQLDQLISAYQHPGKLCLFDRAGALIAMETNGNEFLANFDQGESRRDVTQKMLLYAGKSREGSFSLREKTGDRLDVQFLSLSYSDFILCSVTSQAEIESQLDGIRGLTLGICSVITLIYGLMLFLGMRYLYRPMRSLYENVRDENGKQEWRQNEVELIRSTLLSLRREKQILTEEVRQKREKLREYGYGQLLRGTAYEGQDTDLTGAGLIVVAFHVDSPQGKYFGDRDEFMVRYAVHNLLSDVCYPEKRIALIEMDGCHVAVLQNTDLPDSTFASYVMLEINEAQSTIARLIDIPVSAGISGIIRGVEQLSAGYEQACKALSYRILSEQPIVLSYNSIPTLTENPSLLIQMTNARIVDALKLGETEMAESALRDLIYKVLTDKVDVLYHQEAYLRLITQLQSLILEIGAEGLRRDRNMDKLLGEFMLLKTRDRIYGWFREHLLDISRQVEEYRRTANREIVEKMYALVKEKGCGVTLEECAALLHYNPNYLGRVFMLTAGKKFSDYLSELRVDASRELLRETDLLVSDIARKLGYSNAQNFIRAFKKATGLTPAAYRKK